MAYPAFFATLTGPDCQFGPRRPNKKELTIIRSELVRARSSGPSPDVFLTRVELQSLLWALRRRIEFLAEVCCSDNVQESFLDQGVLLNDGSFRGLNDVGADVEIAAVFAWDEGFF